MKINYLIIAVLFLLCLAESEFSQKKLSLPIINGAANSLPKPEYTEEAKRFCASGKVEIEVLVDENGNVEQAKAISGDELLWEFSIEAAKSATFRKYADGVPVKTKGIIVYNFVSENKCITFGVVNNKARILPKPVYPKSCRCTGVIKVRVVIDMNGDVIHASAVSGNPLLRISAVEAARKAKLPPTLINTSKPIYVIAFLEYKFDAGGKIST